MYQQCSSGGSEAWYFIEFFHDVSHEILVIGEDKGLWLLFFFFSLLKSEVHSELSLFIVHVYLLNLTHCSDLSRLIFINSFLWIECLELKRFYIFLKGALERSEQWLSHLRSLLCFNIRSDMHSQPFKPLESLFARRKQKTSLIHPIFQ